jgi:hypothetical protein
VTQRFARVIFTIERLATNLLARRAINTVTTPRVTRVLAAFPRILTTFLTVEFLGTNHFSFCFAAIAGFFHQITTIFFAGTSVTSHRTPMLSAAQFFVARVATRRHFLRAREHHLLFATETRSCKCTRARPTIACVANLLAFVMTASVCLATNDLTLEHVFIARSYFANFFALAVLSARHTARRTIT